MKIVSISEAWPSAWEKTQQKSSVVKHLEKVFELTDDGARDIVQKLPVTNEGLIRKIDCIDELRKRGRLRE